jgi:hypothetical protein
MPAMRHGSDVSRIGIRNMNTVPAGCGWKWVLTGFALFRKNPAMWAFLVFSYIVLMQLLGMIPVLGWSHSGLSGIFLYPHMLASRGIPDAFHLRE